MGINIKCSPKITCRLFRVFKKMAYVGIHNIEGDVWRIWWKKSSERNRQEVSWPTRYCACWKLRAHGCCSLCGPLQSSHLWHFGKLQNNHDTLFQSCATPYQTNVGRSTLNVLGFFPQEYQSLKNSTMESEKQCNSEWYITSYYTMYYTIKTRLGQKGNLWQHFLIHFSIWHQD